VPRNPHPSPLPSQLNKRQTTVDAHFDAIARDLLREMGGRTWKGRQGATAALGDLLQGRRWDQLGPHIKEVSGWLIVGPENSSAAIQRQIQADLPQTSHQTPNPKTKPPTNPDVGDDAEGNGRCEGVRQAGGAGHGQVCGGMGVLAARAPVTGTPALLLFIRFHTNHLAFHPKPTQPPHPNRDPFHQTFNRTLRGVSIRLMDTAQTPSRDVAQCCSTLLPLLLESGLLSNVAEVKGLALDVLTQAVRSAGPGPLAPLAPALVPGLLEALSGLEVSCFLLYQGVLVRCFAESLTLLDVLPPNLLCIQDSRLNYLEQHAQRIGGEEAAGALE
jgi:hypothetical protein